MDGPTDRRTDKASYRVACPQLKKGVGRKNGKMDGQRPGWRERQKNVGTERWMDVKMNRGTKIRRDRWKEGCLGRGMEGQT